MLTFGPLMQVWEGIKIQKKEDFVMATKDYNKITTMASTFFFIFFAFSYLSMAAVHKEKNRREILNKVCTLQIPFIENKGQIKGESVRYYVKSIGGFVNPQSEIHPGRVAKNALHRAGNPKCEGWAIKESFVGGCISNIKGEEEAVTKVNYFKGKDPSKWRKNIATYNLVSLGEIYKGIELKLKAYGNNVEKLFTVLPEQDPEVIKIKITGAK